MDLEVRALDEIKKLCDSIVELVSPEKIILFNQKVTLDGKVSSFKVCVIANGNPAEIEGEIYLSTDCPIHFDVLVYSSEDWEKYILDADSFAHRIWETGSVIYGEER